MDYSNLSKNLNYIGKNILIKIKNEYSLIFNENQKKLLNSLLDKENNFVVVETDEKNFFDNKIKDGELSVNDVKKYYEYSKNKYLSNEEKEEFNKISPPIAHGGRTFNDDKIHFYPFVKKNNNLDLLIGILIHEIFHYFIRPKKISETLELSSFNEFLTEGLVDMYTRDFLKKYPEYSSNYTSNYSKNTIFVRELLDSKKDKDYCVFNNSTAELIDFNEEVIRQYNDLKNNNNSFIQLIDKISRNINEKQQSEIKHSILNYLANCSSTEEINRDLLNFVQNTNIDENQKNEIITKIKSPNNIKLKSGKINILLILLIILIIFMTIFLVYLLLK